MSRRTLAVVTALATIYVVWGSTYLGIALVLETMPPLLSGGVRFLLAGAALTLVARRFGDPQSDPIGRAQWSAAIVCGTLLIAIGNGGVMLGQRTIGSGVAALLIAAVPLWIAVLDRLAFGQRLGARALVGLGLGFGGIALLVDPRGALDAVGAAFLLAASVGWAAGSLLTRGAALPRRPLVAAGMQMLVGGVALTLAGLASGEAADVDVGAFSTRSVVGFLYLVVFGSVLAFSAYTWLLRATRTSLVATYAYVNPVVAVALGWAFLGEDVTATTVVAGAVIVGAVALIVSSPRATPRRAPVAAMVRAR